MTRQDALALAEQVLTLVNARPSTPSREEVAGLVADVGEAAQALAEAILGLINAGPRTPSREAIAALIEQQTVPAAPAEGAGQGRPQQQERPDERLGLQEPGELQRVQGQDLRSIRARSWRRRVSGLSSSG